MRRGKTEKLSLICISLNSFFGQGITYYIQLHTPLHSTEHRSITKCCRESTDFFISRGFWNRLKNNVTVTYVICGCFKRIQSQHEKFTTECKATIARQYSTWRPLYHSYSNRYSAVQLFLFLTFVKTKNANTKKQLSKDTAYEHHHHHHHHHQHVHYSA